MMPPPGGRHECGLHRMACGKCGWKGYADHGMTCPGDPWSRCGAPSEHKGPPTRIVMVRLAYEDHERDVFISEHRWVPVDPWASRREVLRELEARGLPIVDVITRW